MTGLSLDTLRAWERRYQVVTPRRDDRGRVYDDHDVERLKRLARLVDHGHAIGTIAGLSNAALDRLINSAVPKSHGRMRDEVDVAPLIRAIGHTTWPRSRRCSAAMPCCYRPTD